MTVKSNNNELQTDILKDNIPQNHNILMKQKKTQIIRSCLRINLKWHLKDNFKFVIVKNACHSWKPLQLFSFTKDICNLNISSLISFKVKGELGMNIVFIHWNEKLLIFTTEKLKLANVCHFCLLHFSLKHYQKCCRIFFSWWTLIYCIFWCTYFSCP